jgi:hypothetical protein
MNYVQKSETTIIYHLFPLFLNPKLPVDNFILTSLFGFFLPPPAPAQVSMLSEDESDAEVMQRLAPLSRSIQDFIAS